MSLFSTPPLDPLAPVLGPLARLAARLPPDESPTGVERRAPQDVLADLLDLHGSVQLADRLEEWGKGEPEALEASADEPEGMWGEEHLRRQVAGRVAYLTRLVQSRFDTAYTGTAPLPGPAAMHEILLDFGVLETRRARTILRAADALGAPFVALLERCIKTVRVELSFLRDDLAGELRALGPRGRLLEELDVSLMRATHVRSRKLYDALGDRLGACFAQDLASALAVLPKDQGPESRHVVEAIEAWYAPGGWVHQHHADLLRLALGLSMQEAGVLTGLVDAVCELRSAGRTPK